MAQKDDELPISSTSPSYIPIFLSAIVVIAVFAFLAYYGWLHTPGKPWKQFG